MAFGYFSFLFAVEKYKFVVPPPSRHLNISVNPKTAYHGERWICRTPNYSVHSAAFAMPPRPIKRTRDPGGPNESGRGTKTRQPPSSSSSQSRSSQPSLSSNQPPSSYTTVYGNSSQASNDAINRVSFQDPVDDSEPATQDLTQSDDGPDYELYGSLGRSFSHLNSQLPRLR